MGSSTKVRENRLRAKAERQGLALRRSRRRDPLALDYGTYWLDDRASGRVLEGGPYGTTLDELEIVLARGRVRVIGVAAGGRRRA